MNEEEVRRLIAEILQEKLNELLDRELGERAVRAINERRRAQGKSDLNL